MKKNEHVLKAMRNIVNQTNVHKGTLEGERREEGEKTIVKESND